MKRALSIPGILALVAFSAGCPGDDQQQQPAPAADQPAAQAPAGTAPPAMSPEQAAALPPGVTAEMIAQGQQLYGTVCVACHGAAGVGTPLGPALTDQDWIHITGDFEELVNIIDVGVAQPQEYPAPMPPRGGGNFNPDQIRAIAAYVYTISHD